MNLRMRKMLADCDKHNTKIKQKAKKESRENVEESIDRATTQHFCGLDGNGHFRGFEYQPGQFEKIFGHK